MRRRLGPPVKNNGVFIMNVYTRFYYSKHACTYFLKFFERFSSYGRLAQWAIEV